MQDSTFCGLMKKATVICPQCPWLYPVRVKNHRNLNSLNFSSSTPTVPYSTTDILYGNEVRNSPQLDEIRQNSFIEYSKDKDRLSSNNLVDFNNRRPASKGGTRKSLSIEKVNFNKESDDNLRPILPSPGKNGNQYRPNGLRNGLLKGDPLYGSRGGNYSSVEPRYTDPVIGAQPSFQQRLMELSALESETIRYEKSKKVKKKVRDRDS
ncbi:unnamed protein product [Mytilus coruscus]|uniref:Uncharacterized protein n=1 Tax=Mytilus coruscus TaxID=42192 RepID=A0A6J8ARU5_MYTCO|nr:unnamed protein product [Mytilus coruscus]